MARLALTEKRRIDCDGYIFPAEYYDIPGLEDFQDLRSVKDMAFGKLKEYGGQHIDIYLNGGMSIEILAVIQAAAKLDIHIALWEYDCQEKIYVRQEIRWKPADHRGQTGREKGEAVFLCQGRHWNPKQKSVFGLIPAEKIFDFKWQEQQAEEFLEEYRGGAIKIYLSGLTAACISVLNAAYKKDVSVTWLHYNYDMEEYFEQNMEEF